MTQKAILNASLLLVDDDASLLSMLAEFLGEQGAEIHTALDGLEALDVLRSKKIDIVLTDRNMPSLGGHELLLEVREQWPDVDVIMMTSVASVRNAVEAMRMGAVDYIEKPIDLTATRSILQRVAENRRVRLERDQLKAEVALRELGQVITSNLHMAELPNRVADLITRVFHVDDITLQYRFPGGDSDTLYWRSNGRNLNETETLIMLEATSRGQVVQQVSTQYRWTCIPLMSDSQTRGGILLVQPIASVPFLKQQVDLMQIMGGHVNIALENAYLYQVATRQMRNTQQLAEISRGLNTSLEFEDTLDRVHEGVKSFLDADFYLVIWLDRSLSELHVDMRGRMKPSDGLKESILARLETRIARIREPEFTWNRREDTSSYSHAKGAGVDGSIRFGNWVPLTDDQGCMGLLGVMKLTGDDYLARQIQSFMLLSSPVSSALQNAILFHNQRRLHLDTVQVLSKAIDEKDHYIHGHSAQVGAIAIKVAKRMGITDTRALEDIHLGGLMHDLGKIGIRDAVLNKPGKLTAEEYKHIQTHPGIGSKILSRAPHLSHLDPFVRNHHERWDGSGYPDGLRGSQIPLKVRILTLADTFHAMASDRIYRKGIPLDKIFAYLSEMAGVMFDPALVKVILTMWEQNEIGLKDINYDSDLVVSED
jgi:response regulator RpfG family c-di-GMP phosphodiesterase